LLSRNFFLNFQGAFLLDEIMRVYKNSKIICLVRSSDDEDAKRRIIENMNFYNLWQLNYVDRISPVYIFFVLFVILQLAGDLGKEKFGLSDSKYEGLCDSVFIYRFRI
jgi:thioester reductase-like protein